MKNFEVRLKTFLFEVIVFGVFASGAMFFSFVYGTFLVTLNAERLAPLLVPGLAVFYGFSALMYNRARAVASSAEQRRSLYAGERALQATILYVTSVAIAAAISGFFALAETSPQPIDSEPPLTRLLAFAVPIVLMGFAWSAFFFAFHAMAHRVLGWQRPRIVLRRVR